MPSVIEAREVRKRFSDVDAVRGISFHVVSGECFGILGPNGAGKTSTIRMIYGYSPLTSGELLVFGQDISRYGSGIRSRIGVCQQENTLDPDLTLKQNLEVFARYFDIPRDVSRQRADELLQFIGLAHRRESEVAQLSGGMVRRAVLARALINQPDLLILDEPTTGLDPQSRHLIWDRLDELKRKGLSILLTTHYMDEAARLCDRLLIMDHGVIIVEGRPSALIREYVGEHVLEFSSPADGLREDLRKRNVPHEDLGSRILVYGQRDDALFKRIGEQYCLEECAMRMSTLEDVFLRLTGRGLRE